MQLNHPERQANARKWVFVSWLITDLLLCSCAIPIGELTQTRKSTLGCPIVNCCVAAPEPAPPKQVCSLTSCRGRGLLFGSIQPRRALGVIGGVHNASNSCQMTGNSSKLDFWACWAVPWPPKNTKFLQDIPIARKKLHFDFELISSVGSWDMEHTSRRGERRADPLRRWTHSPLRTKASYNKNTCTLWYHYYACQSVTTTIMLILCNITITLIRVELLQDHFNLVISLVHL